MVMSCFVQSTVYYYKAFGESWAEVLSRQMGIATKETDADGGSPIHKDKTSEVHAGHSTDLER